MFDPSVINNRNKAQKVAREKDAHTPDQRTKCNGVLSVGRAALNVWFKNDIVL